MNPKDNDIHIPHVTKRRSQEQEKRKKRLANALRENLYKRKSQKHKQTLKTQNNVVKDS
tara:strand:- start:438 stop:614 length:177 start_codon:yes stop_codon:yes gene_type:complete